VPRNAPSWHFTMLPGHFCYTDTHKIIILGFSVYPRRPSHRAIRISMLSLFIRSLSKYFGGRTLKPPCAKLVKMVLIELQLSSEAYKALAIGWQPDDMFQIGSPYGVPTEHLHRHCAAGTSCRDSTARRLVPDSNTPHHNRQVDVQTHVDAIYLHYWI
jgi:hypothetical protein